ncbi:frigida-LIKE protein [Medicago truncatula]|uniref:FRIGIDA-like protein n=2 Tax=Medicago truncatula TaxID=3880 RepID=A0A072VB38_MEDTR|nr:frigida-LIKE protein [Medicago truncatula]
MLLPCDQTDELESICDDIQVNLQGLSDPSKVVLDIIQNPIIQKCEMGDNVVIIDDSHILLLIVLMRISPDIKPHVREDAMKLALDLKANMKENNGNSLVVLGFLLLLSIYGLVPSFNEDDVLKLFGLVSQYDIGVELFGALGFADKISDFVQSLIKKQQYDEAVRFSCAYNFSNNTQLVDIFQEHVQNLNLIFESSCKEANSIEIKDKA